MNARAIKDLIVLIVVLSAIFPSDAWAYLDPGAGSLFIQGTLAAIAAGLYALRVYWNRLRSLWKPDSSNESSEWTEGDGGNS